MVPSNLGSKYKLNEYLCLVLVKDITKMYLRVNQNSKENLLLNVKFVIALGYKMYLRYVQFKKVNFVHLHFRLQMV